MKYTVFILSFCCLDAYSLQTLQCYIMFMERKQGYLSLGNWPKTPCRFSQLPLTPISKKILSKVSVQPHDILPLTFIQFCKAEEKIDQDCQMEKQRFICENERREKQAAILANIRNKYILGKDYNSPITDSKAKKRSIIKSRQTSNKTNSDTERKQHFSNLMLNKAISPTISARRRDYCSLRSPITKKDLKKYSKQKSQYVVHYDPYKQNDSLKSKLQEESKNAKGKPKVKTEAIEDDHYEYGTFLSKKSNIKTKKEQTISNQKHEDSKQLCHQLLLTVERWQQLDRMHLQEMRKMKHLNECERSRLSKIQEIEKKEMRKRVNRIKSRLNSQNYYE